MVIFARNYNMCQPFFVAFVPSNSGEPAAFLLVPILSILPSGNYAQILSPIIKAVSVDMIGFHTLWCANDNGVHKDCMPLSIDCRGLALRIVRIPPFDSVPPVL